MLTLERILGNFPFVDRLQTRIGLVGAFDVEIVLLALRVGRAAVIVAHNAGRVGDIARERGATSGRNRANPVRRIWCCLVWLCMNNDIVSLAWESRFV